MCSWSCLFRRKNYRPSVSVKYIQNLPAMEDTISIILDSILFIPRSPSPSMEIKVITLKIISTFKIIDIYEGWIWIPYGEKEKKAGNVPNNLVPFTAPDTSNPRHIKPTTHQTSDKEYRAANYTTDKNTFSYFNWNPIWKLENELDFQIFLQKNFFPSN